VASKVDEASAESFPASDPVAVGTGDEAEGQPEVAPTGAPAADRPRRPTAVVMEDGTETEVDHGAVVIAAITSCTNTSNPP
jgi:aconitate hydratase